MKKYSFLVLSFLLLLQTQTISAVEWPQKENTDSSIVSYFGQNISGQMSTSIIFSEPAEIQAIKDGTILIVMTDIEDDSEFFPSSFGTAVILAHEDDLISVYSNLDTNSIIETTESKKELKEGEIIGLSGNTGWQQKKNGLEFQIIDTQKASAINPKILLPRTDAEKDYSLNGVMLQNKDGVFFDIRERKNYPSGTYKVYHTRNTISTPYKMTTFINGLLSDEISFDTISMQNGSVFIKGKKQYDSEIIYPNENMIFTGEIMLTPGKSILSISVEDFLGKSKQLNYNLTIY